MEDLKALLPYSLRQLASKVRGNKFLTNSISLMLASAVSAGIGFIFWIVVARSFDTETVGIATTLLSMSALIGLLSQAGFDTVLIRFLPQASDKNSHINTGLVVTGVIGTLLAVLFCLLTPELMPKLSPILDQPAYMAAFIACTVLATWNALTNSIFIAYRRADFVLLISFVFSLLKVALPFVITSGGSMAIFLFIGAAQLLNLVLSLTILVRKFNFRPRLRISKTVVQEIRTFGATAYVSSIFNLSSDFLLPIIVLNQLGPTQAAFFYIAFTTASLLYTIAFATSQACLAEASQHGGPVRPYVIKNIKLAAMLMVPAVAVLSLLSPFIMSLFGEEYQAGAAGLLIALSLSGLIVAAQAIIGMVFKVRKDLRGMLVLPFANGLSILLLSFPLTDRFGLLGIGYAWAGGYLISITVGLIVLYTRKRGDPAMEVAA